VWQIGAKLRPGSGLEVLYLFAWNPLVLLMAAGDGHNDMAMMACVLLGFWFLLQESWALSFGALALSASIKYVGALFVPLFVLYTWDWSRRESQRMPWLALLSGGFAFFAVTAVIYAPLGSVEWGVGVLHRLIRPANWAFAFPPERAARTPGLVHGAGSVPTEMLPWLPTLVLVIGLLAFAAAYLYLSARLVLGLKRERLRARPLQNVQGQGGLLAPKKAQTQMLFNVGFVVSLLIFVLGAARSQPWHLIWPASLAGLSAQKWAWPPVITLSAVMLLTQVWVEWGTPGLVTLFSEAL